MKECELIKGGHTFGLLAVRELTVLQKHPLTYKDRQLPNLAAKMRLLPLLTSILCTSEPGKHSISLHH